MFSEISLPGAVAADDDVAYGDPPVLPERV
jgi:hypothetical protein